MISKEEAVVAILEECKRFSTDCLTKYIHKYKLFQTELTIDQVHELHQKIDIVLDMVKDRGSAGV